VEVEVPVPESWDAATGQVGWQLDQLPDSELAIWSNPVRL
jgi:hypothetical protein